MTSMDLQRPMKIRSIEPIVLKIPFSAGADNTGFGDKPWTSYDMLVVRVETDTGIIGWGEAWAMASFRRQR